MKTLFLSLIGTFLCCSLFAQVDSTHNSNNMNTMPAPPTQMNNNNSMNNNPTDTSRMNNMNNSQMDTTRMNNMNNNMNSTKNRDSSSILNSVNTNNDNNTNSNMNSNNNNMNMNSNNNMSSMNNNSSNSLNNTNSGMINPNNTPGQEGWAALPVMETYVPENIIADVKQRHPNTVIYDITAVKAPVDSSSMNQSMNGMHDSAMNQNSTMNNNSNTTMNSSNNMNSNNTSSNTMNTNNTANSTNNNMNSNNTGMGQDSTMAKPQQYCYIVRFDDGGKLTSETLNNDGTALVNNVPGWKNQ